MNEEAKPRPMAEWGREKLKGIASEFLSHCPDVAEKVLPKFDDPEFSEKDCAWLLVMVMQSPAAREGRPPVLMEGI